jgi:biopolymer transport protein ExbD
MSTWRIRHEGSPRSIDGLTLQQVLEGLADGQWEPIDEVMGPKDSTWVAIENHPDLAEIAADLEPRPPRTYDDETRLDMNALIDVCLVLLIFFILTTTVAALQKRLEAPTATGEQGKVAVVTEKQIEEQMIWVKANMVNGEPQITLEKDVVDIAKLLRELRAYVKRSRKTEMLLEHDDEIPHETVVQILDSAKGAGIDRVRLAVPN